MAELARSRRASGGCATSLFLVSMGRARRESRAARSFCVTLWSRKRPRDPRQRLQMVSPCRFRRYQQKQQVDGLAVQRLEVDRAAPTCANSPNSRSTLATCRGEWRCLGRSRSSQAALVAAASRRCRAPAGRSPWRRFRQFLKRLLFGIGPEEGITPSGSENRKEAWWPFRFAASAFTRVRA